MPRTPWILVAVACLALFGCAKHHGYKPTSSEPQKKLVCDTADSACTVTVKVGDGTCTLCATSVDYDVVQVTDRTNNGKGNTITWTLKDERFVFAENGIAFTEDREKNFICRAADPRTFVCENRNLVKDVFKYTVNVIDPKRIARSPPLDPWVVTRS